MPVTVDYGENGRIVYVAFIDPWTTKEVQPIIETFIEYLESVPFTVHGIFDPTQTSKMPPGIMGIRLHRLLSHHHAGFVVLYDGSTLIRTLAQLLFRAAHFHRFYMVETRQEAIDFITDVIASES